MSNINNVIVVNIIILIVATLGNLPYGFYTLLRLVVFVTFSFMAYQIYQKEEFSKITTINIVISLLYNPFVKVHFDKNIWIIINIATAIYCMLLLINIKKWK